jgi:hypothetical protein
MSMIRNVMMKGLFLACLLCLTLALPFFSSDLRSGTSRSSQQEMSGEGITLSAAATIRSYASITVFTTVETTERGGDERPNLRDSQYEVSAVQKRTTIRFHALSGPGVYKADRNVIVRVGSNTRGWTITVEATPLTGSKGSIPAERVFVKGPGTDSSVDKGAGPGFDSLSSPKLVAIGLRRGLLDVPVEFKLKTGNQDRAGFYTGLIYVNCLMAP